jgi:hypothetical protein
VATPKIYSLYEAATGLFTGKRLHCDEDELIAMKLPSGTLAIEGVFDPSRQRVHIETGTVVSYAPASPSAEEERRALVFARIQALEATQGRAVREAALGDTMALKRLQDIDMAISELRAELELE